MWDRARFLVEQGDLDPGDRVVIDAFGSNLDMTPSSARTPRDERALAALPRNTPPTTTTINSLSTKGMGPSLMTVEGVTSMLFEAYGKPTLGPSLRLGQVVLLDNLSAHKACDCPKYCPLQLPIVLPTFVPAGLLANRVGHRQDQDQGATDPHPHTRGVGAAVAQALKHISTDDAHGFFTHCGFRSRLDLAQRFRP